jgi:hypothetical protein
VIITISYGGNLIMKMKITVEIKNDDGSKTIEPIAIDTDIPDFEDFKGPDNFREVFDKCERSVLKIRNKSTELAIEEYLTELSKKKHLEKPIEEKTQK